jgi:riboflavin kinase/FMN adenylyltransferase
MRMDMQYFTDINSYHGLEKTAITLGKFDSLHRGHQRLIQTVQEYALNEKIKSVVFSFDINKENLLTNSERRMHLENQVDCMIQCPFTKAIREMEAEVFIEEILVNKLHASFIVVGKDFQFGYNKRGNADMLSQYAAKYQYKIKILDKELYKGREISSTYVREALRDGNVELANTLLGYRYHVSGIVEHGKKLGRTLGFPTMNIALPERKISPLFGVYACRIKVGGQIYKGIGNVGYKPTVSDENRLLLEVFVFDYHKDAYGENITVEFCAFERAETKFDSVEKLKQQVEQDIAYGKEYFHKSDSDFQ